MIDPDDMAHCVEAIRHGSRSFHAASRLLPRAIRDPALALYAFCRLADDAVDLQTAKAEAVLRLHDRLDRAYAGRPLNAPADRAFASIIESFDMPRTLPEALLEGLAWDAMGRRHATLSDLRAYSARVAAAVGAMMCVLMRVRDRHALARACDLGVAMQLTNIARDVGEDAREGRLYLPLEWLEEVGLEPERFLAAPEPGEQVSELVRRLLREAEVLYLRAESGIAALPLACRPGIFAARHIYAGIGGAVMRNGCDSVSRRARTSGADKAGWLMLSLLRTGSSAVMPRSARVYAPPLPETAFLVEAAADRSQPETDWSDAMYATLARLKARDRAQRRALMDEGAHARQPRMFWLCFFIFLAACAGAGATGGLFPPGPWYDRLRKPAWTPPNWVFPVAWTTLYLLMAGAGARAAMQPENGVAMALWALQIALNGLWTPVFFGLHKLRLGMIVLGFLWVAVLLCMIALWRVDTWAGVFFVPYLAWVTTAGALNWSVMRLNPDADES